jgi:hypothetical protein
LELPTVDERTYVLVDDDAKECRVIAEDEFNASYVDNNIQTFQLQDLNWLTLDVDNQYVTITYSSGAQTAVLLGSIDYNAGRSAEQYGKTNGVIYPIDEAGTFLFNNSNTPNLVAIRTWYYNEAKRVNDERLEIAEVVHAFADAISELGHAGETVDDMTQP